MSKKTITYDCFVYKQLNDSKGSWIVTFVSSAEELLGWAGIPRRLSNDLLGFQRPDNAKRVAKAAKFFDYPENLSPTALIVGLHPNIEGDESINLKFVNGEPTNPLIPSLAKLEITIKENPSIDETVEKLQKHLKGRLNSTPTETPAEEMPAEDGDSAESEGEDEETDENESPSDSKNLEIGKSLINKFSEKLNSPKWCTENAEHLKELAKPATIIDGQHRVLGANSKEQNIPFTVCAILNCKWEEQVFQFTVVNYTAEGIPDQFITNNAAMSLTTEELEKLKHRLEQADVKILEYELMRVVNFNSESPFFNRVNLTEKTNPSLIGYKTMVQIAKKWHSGKPAGIKKLIDTIFPSIKGKKQKIHFWKEKEIWGQYFLIFWKEVKKFYSGFINDEGVGLWDPGSNLIIAVVLLEYQELFLKNLNNQSRMFFQVDPNDASQNADQQMRKKVKEQASEFVKRITPEFFQEKWGSSSLNTGPGREALKSALQATSDDEKFRFRNSNLFTGRF